MGREKAELEFRLDRTAPIACDLSYHHVSGKHLWIAVEKGSVLVLNDDLHAILKQLIGGVLPRKIILDAEDGETCVRRLEQLVKKCGEAGFLDGVLGHRVLQSSEDARRFARLHITNRCQLQCIHCYTDASLKEESGEELTTDEWRGIITDLAENGCSSIVFTGGEPLVRRDCVELLKRAHDCGIENIGVMTNGLLVPRYIDDLADSVSSVQIGLDGADEETNDKIRGRGTFRKVIRALDALSHTDLDVRVSVALMEMNWHSIRENLVKLSDRYDKEQIKFKIGKGLLDYGRATLIRDSLDTFPIQREVSEFNTSFYSPTEILVHQQLRICGIFSQILIAHDGQVYPCHLQHRSMGHISDRSIREWQDVYVEQWHKYTVDQVEMCKNCDLRNICGGSCKVLDEKRTGSEFISSCTPLVVERTYENLVRIFS